MKSLLTQPFVKLVTGGLKNDLGKVNKLLKLYAESRGTEVEKLHLLHICDENGELCPALLSFIAGLRPYAGQTPENFVKYKRQAKSRIRKIVRGILAAPARREQRPLFPIHLSVPPFLYPILHLLQRTWRGRHVATPAVGEELSKAEIRRRLNTPLTDNGRALLMAILITVEKYKLLTVASVMVDHASDVIAAIKATCPPRKWASTVDSFRRLRSKLGYPRIPKPPKLYIDIKDWPPTLKQQAEAFLEKASSEIAPDDPLVRLAAQFGIELKRLKAKTRENYILAVSKALAFIPYGADLGVIDLLTLKPVKRQFGEGRFTEELHNELVDVFREHERNLATDRKRAGFDSDIFKMFRRAVTCIAAFNGIVDLQEGFRKAYRPRSDKGRKREVKAYKKRTFPLEWVDKEIIRLGVEFHRIVRTGTFRLENEGVGKKQSRKNLRLCTYYVLLVTLRYMGYRQQCARDCKVGRNIVFDKDGTITFFWEKDKIKNGRVISANLNKKDHGLTHGLMIDALWAYYKHVYPYLKRRATGGGRGQFFLKLSNDQGATTFVPDDETCFGIQFKNWSLEFLDFGDRMANTTRNFNPHHLRGLCTDWLIYDLELSLEEAAQVIGDSVVTLEAEYLDKTKPCDATPVLKKANRILRAKKDSVRADAMEDEVEQYRGQLARKEEQVTTLLQELKSANEWLGRMEAERGTLQATVESLRADMSSVRAQSELHHRETIEVLKGNGKAGDPAGGVEMLAGV